MSLRGVLRGFGLKVGPTTPKTFAGRVRALVAHHDTLQTIAEALLSARTVLEQEFKAIEKRLSGLARANGPTRRLMTTPGVGAIVALTFVSAIEDPARFRSSRMVGAHFGLTPRKHQSGETDVTGRISRVGDHGVRVALYEAANVILTRAVKGSDLKSWALGVAKRAGMKKAKRRACGRNAEGANKKITSRGDKDGVSRCAISPVVAWWLGPAGIAPCRAAREHANPWGLASGRGRLRAHGKRVGWCRSWYGV